MLTEFHVWRLNQKLQIVNEAIEEINQKLSVSDAFSQIPKIGYLDVYQGRKGAKDFIEKAAVRNPKGNSIKEGIRDCLVDAFKQEQRIQREGIRHPPGVIINKIEHQVLNYDIIQDAISDLVRSEKIACCDALTVRKELKKRFYNAVESVIDLINFPLKLGGGIEVSEKELRNANSRFYERDVGKLRDQQMLDDCGDCGGGRSSARWKSPSAPLRPDRFMHRQSSPRRLDVAYGKRP